MGFFFAPNHYGVVSEITKKLLNEINTWYQAIRFLYFFATNLWGSFLPQITMGW
jgi:hypothetical protein